MINIKDLNLSKLKKGESLILLKTLFPELVENDNNEIVPLMKVGNIINSSEINEIQTDFILKTIYKKNIYSKKLITEKKEQFVTAKEILILLINNI